MTPDPEEAALHREVVEVMWRVRTVEGDLGVRWGAMGVVAAAITEQLVDSDEAALLETAARQRTDDPAFLADDETGRAIDARLAELALTVALRRHARPQESGEVRHLGKDLRGVRLVVGSGGVLRHAAPQSLRHILAPAISDHAGGWKVPTHASLAVDSRYVLAAAGLLARDHPEAAARLVTGALSRLPLGGPGVIGFGHAAAHRFRDRPRRTSGARSPEDAVANSLQRIAAGDGRLSSFQVVRAEAAAAEGSSSPVARIWRRCRWPVYPSRSRTTWPSPASRCGPVPRLPLRSRGPSTTRSYAGCVPRVRSSSG